MRRDEEAGAEKARGKNLSVRTYWPPVGLIVWFASRGDSKVGITCFCVSKERMSDGMTDGRQDIAGMTDGRQDIAGIIRLGRASLGGIDVGGMDWTRNRIKTAHRVCGH